MYVDFKCFRIVLGQIGSNVWKSLTMLFFNLLTSNTKIELRLYCDFTILDNPPVDLHLIFEKSSLKNQVGRTNFLIFTACVARRGPAFSIVNAYCQFSQQACTNKMQTYMHWSPLTCFLIVTINLHCSMKNFFGKIRIIFDIEN